MGQYLDVARKVVADAKANPQTCQRYDLNDLNDKRSEPVSKEAPSAVDSEGWDAETRRLIDWFSTTTPPAEPFELCRGVTILDPARWWRSIRGDIETGPTGPRARYGAVQGDLRRLYDLIEGTGGISK